MRTLFIVSLLALGAFSAGCKSPCRALSEKLCDCTVNSVQRDECVRQAARAEATYPPSEEQQEACEALVDACDCKKVDTTEGKKNCGLAVP